jgi:hypothetical protein
MKLAGIRSLPQLQKSTSSLFKTATNLTNLASYRRSDRRLSRLHPARSGFHSGCTTFTRRMFVAAKIEEPDKKVT